VLEEIPATRVHDFAALYSADAAARELAGELVESGAAAAGAAPEHRRQGRGTP
jgi:hypothetical protein